MADSEAEKTAVTVGGLRAVEVRYRAVRETDSGNVKFYQTQIRLNSPSMGVLMPERFLPVLEFDDRAVSVFELALAQVLKAQTKFTERDLSFDWISLYMPLRLLRRPDCLSIISAVSEKYQVSPGKICFELSPSLLEEKDKRCARTVNKLRESGYHLMLSGMQGDSVQLMSLCAYDLDFIVLSQSVTDMIGASEKADVCVKSLISFISDCGAEPIADITDSKLCPKLYDFECLYYTGGGPESFMLERFVRKRQEQ